MFRILKKRERDKHDYEKMPLSETSGEPLGGSGNKPSTICSNSGGSQKIRLGVDLSAEHHRRLRTYAATNCMTILAVVEGWIDDYCPE